VNSSHVGVTSVSRVSRICAVQNGWETEESNQVVCKNSKSGSIVDVVSSNTSIEVSSVWRAGGGVDVKIENSNNNGGDKIFLG